MRRIGNWSLALVFTACSGTATVDDPNEGDKNKPATLEALVVTAPLATLSPDDTAQLTAFSVWSNGTLEDATGDVTWSSTNDMVLSVDAEGLVTAEASGSAVLTATLGDVSGFVALTVVDTSLLAVVITPGSLTLPVGQASTLACTGVFSNGTTADLSGAVSWGTGDGDIALVSSGIVTAVATGTTSITATFGGGTHSASIDVTVSAATLRAISVISPEASVALGTSVSMKAAGIFTDAHTTDLTATATWSSGTPSVATVTGGLVTAHTAGTAEITARDTTSGIEGSFTLTVTAASLTSLVVTPPSPVLASGSHVALSVTGVFSDGSSQDFAGLVSWSSEDESVAQVNGSGIVTGVASGGPVAVTARHVATNITYDVDVTVSSASIVGLVVDPQSVEHAPLGTEPRFTATGIFSDGTQVDLTNDVSWSSLPAGIVTIDDGVVTTLAAGTTEVTATLASPLLSDSATLEVTEVELVEISVTPESPYVSIGTTQHLTATAVYDDGTVIDVTPSMTWASDDDNIASVDATTGVITGVAIGQVSVHGTHAATGAVADVTVNVDPAALVSIFTTPPSLTLETYTPVQLRAFGVFTDGSVQEITNDVTWTSGSASAVVHPTTGVATGVATGGPVLVTARAGVGGPTDATALTFTAPTVAAFFIAPDNVQLAHNVPVQMTATVRYSNGRSADLTSSVEWSSSNLPISPSGVLTTTSAGYGTTITAAYTAADPDLTDDTYVSIAGAQSRALLVTPVVSSIPLGTQQTFRAFEVYSDGATYDQTSATTWTSSDDTVLSIDAYGVATAVAASAEPIVITAEYGDYSTDVEVTIVAPVLTALALSPGRESIVAGDTLQYTVSGIMSDDELVQLDTGFELDVADDAVATIDEDGLLTSLTPGTTTITVTHTASGLVSSTTLWVNSASVPHLTAAPSFSSPSLGRGDMVEVSLPVSSDARYVSIYFYDMNGSSAGYTTYSWPDPQSLVTVPLRLGCFAGPLVYVQVNVHDQTTSLYSSYTYSPSTSTSRYYVNQYNPSFVFGGLSPVLVTKVPTVPGTSSCTLPMLASTPTFANAITGGQNVDLTVTTIGDVTSVSVSLYESTSGGYLGTGSVSGSSPFVVPVRTSCLGSGANVRADISLNTSTGWQNYLSRQSGVSNTLYAERYYDGATYSAYLPTSIPLATTAFTPAGSFACMPRLTAVPTFSPTSTNVNGITQVGVQFSGTSSQVTVNLWNTTTGGHGGGNSVSGTLTTSANVNVTTSAAGTYYPRIYIYKPGGGNTDYFRDVAQAGANYREGLSDGFVNVYTITSIAMPTITVSP